MEDWKCYAPIVTRIGLSLVILWFGINQLIWPDYFVGYLPEMFFNSSNASVFILGNGLAEVIFGIMLITGIFTRLVAFVLSLHLFFIAISLGYNENMIRDFGLTLALISIFLAGDDKWCIGNKLKKR